MMPTLPTLAPGVAHHCCTCLVGWHERRRRSVCWSCGADGVPGDIRWAHLWKAAGE